jgi:stearoyl-CoA desaturase (delta-9 desaturase)
VLAGLHLPQLPTRHDILARAKAMFAETPSMEDIVNRAHAVILEGIGARLCAMAVAASPGSA